MKRKFSLFTITLLIFSFLTPGLLPKANAANGEVNAETNVNIPVLLYHRIVENPTNEYTDTSIEHFKNTMIYLDENGYNTLTAEQYVKIMNGEMRVPKNPILLTFDDATSDFVTTALPILQKHDFNAVLFVITDWIGGGYSMSEEQLKSLVGNPNVSIQNHSKTHDGAIWGTDGSKRSEITRAQAEEQIISANQYIKNITGKAPILMAYPYGSYNDVAIQVNKENGIEYAFKVGYPNAGDYAMGRYYVLDKDLSQIAEWIGGPLPAQDTGSGSQTETQTVYHATFEDGTKQGWEPRGGVTLNVVNDVSHSGSASLLTTGRTATWNGPSLDLSGKLKKGAEYEISGWVKLKVAPSTPSQVKITMQHTPTGGDVGYAQVTATDISNTEWTRLEGTYSFTKEQAGQLLYFESNNPDDEFYIDDVTITMVSPPQNSAPEGPVVSAGFEDGTTQGFNPRGADVNLEVATDVSHQGSNSLSVTGRTEKWNGASFNVLDKIQQGVTYDVSTWVKLAQGAAPMKLRISYQLDDSEGTIYKGISGNVEVTDSGWMQLKGTFTLTSEATGLSFYVESDSGLAPFYLDDFIVKAQQPSQIQEDIPSLKNVFKGEFKIGAAVEPAQLTGGHAALLKKHYDVIVAENVMKPINTHPAKGKYTFDAMDEILEFARKSGKTMRYHNLVWHKQVPDWFFKKNGEFMTGPGPNNENKKLLLDRLRTYINTVVDHVDQNYPGVVKSWDVVNEVINTAYDNGLRRSRWYQIAGDDYIRVAFNTVHKALKEDGFADESTLCINDYGINSPAKRDALFDVATRLRSEGVPIECVGNQMHINIQSPSVKQIKKSLEKYAAAGFINEITELDMSIYTDNTSSYPTFDAIPRELYIQQAYRYKNLFNMFESISDDIKSVTFWGIADDHTWLTDRPIPRQDAPFVFDENLQAKPAYWALVNPSKLPPLIHKVGAAKGTPTIDGKVDLSWETVPATEFSGGGNLSASFRTQWNKNHLYVLAHVQDDSYNLEDTVAVFMSENGEPQKFALKRDGRSDADYAVTRTMDGYTVEAEIPLSQPVAVGDQVNFDIRVKEADQNNLMFSWNDTNNNQEDSTAGYGILNLLSTIKISKTFFGTPEIDAQMDDVWENASVLSTNTWVMGKDGATAKFRTLWDDGYLYVYADVTDNLLSAESSAAYQQDSVEIFLDQNNAKTEYYQPDDRQYRVNFKNNQSFAGGASAETFKTATRITDHGYVVEARIKLDIDPSVGTTFGFDFQVNNDADGDGTRDSVVTWNDPTGQSYQNTSRLGVLLLTRDQTPPTTTVSLAGKKLSDENFMGQVKVTLTAKDKQSGVEKTKYRLNGGEWQTYSAPFAIKADGTTSIDYRSVDQAGNIEEIQTLNVRVVAPTFENLYRLIDHAAIHSHGPKRALKAHVQQAERAKDADKRQRKLRKALDFVERMSDKHIDTSSKADLEMFLNVWLNE
ncbi:MAG TPA: endo-1,4-beta-xylanase [Bacillales bacterium]|nr:endo-1,4-beta-xylanase [Bacillales bacterium]